MDRFLQMQGFNVTYFANKGSKKVVKGHFDLRNVCRIKPVTVDAATPDEAIELGIVEPERNHLPPKLMTIAFNDHSERAEWLAYICSAIDPAAIDDEIFTPYIDDALTTTFNNVCAYQPAVSAYLNIFSKGPTAVGVVSKRAPEKAVKGNDRKSLAAAPPKDRLAFESAYHKDDVAELAAAAGSSDAAPAKGRRGSAYMGAPPELKAVMAYDSKPELASFDTPHELDLSAAGALPTGASTAALPSGASGTALGGGQRKSLLKPHTKNGKNALSFLQAKGADLEHMHDAAENAEKKLVAKAGEKKSDLSAGEQMKADKKAAQAARKKAIKVLNGYTKEEEIAAAAEGAPGDPKKAVGNLNKMMHALDGTLKASELSDKSSRDETDDKSALAGAARTRPTAAFSMESSASATADDVGTAEMSEVVLDVSDKGPPHTVMPAGLQITVEVLPAGKAKALSTEPEDAPSATGATTSWA